MPFFTAVHILLLKFSSHLGILLGKIIIWSKKERIVDTKKLQTIYLNRSDRLGDAIISKPFLKLLAEYIRSSEIKARIVIISSKYNHFILADLADPTQNIFVEQEDKTIVEYESKVLNMLMKHIRFLWISIAFRIHHAGKRDESMLFVDFAGGGDLLTILKYKDLYNPIVAGPNIFWGSHVLDIAIDHSYVHYAHQNLIESYIEIIEKIFRFGGGFRNFVYDHIGEFYDYHSENLTEDICLFVGVKEFRNLTPKTWECIIRSVAASFPDQTITVLDDPSNILYETLKDISFPANVRVEKNTYKISEFVEKAKQFRFVVGIDGGGINMVRPFTNTLTIYTFAHHDVWSCFTGRLPYSETTGANDWQTGSATFPTGQTVAYTYKRSFWLPTFNITGNRALFDDFDEEGLLKIIRSSFKKTSS